MASRNHDRGDAEEEAQKLGLQDEVHFPGRIEAVAPLLASSDLFLLPSDRESFGLSALEALATGVPVVGSLAGGLPEVDAGVVLAHLFRRVGDVDGMAKAAVEILGDPARWEAMSRLAASDARERFARDRIVPLYEALYDDALASRRSRRVDASIVGA